MNVLLLEAGGPDTNDLVHLPAAFSALYRTAQDWDHSTIYEPFVNDRRIYLPRGKVLGRLVVDQRDDLHPRQPDRLRRVGPGLDLGRDAALLQARRGQRARRGRVPRGRRAAPGVGGALAEPARPGVPRLGRGARAARERGLQRRGAGRGRLVPGDPPERRPREHGGGVPASGDGPAQPHRRDARARALASVRGRARRRRRGHAAVGDARAPRRARGDRVRRRLQLAAAPDALGPRPSRRARGASDRGGGRGA